MARPRPTPPDPVPQDDQSDFDRPMNLQLRSGGPRDFARATNGSSQVGGSSKVRTPEPQ